MFTPEDDRAGGRRRSAVISYRYWQRRFGGASGRARQARSPSTGTATAIVGVTPQGFDGAMQAGESPDISVPLAHYLRFQPDRGGARAALVLVDSHDGAAGARRDAAQAAASLEPVFQDAAREGWLAGRIAATPAHEVMPAAPTLAADPGAQGENDARRQYARPLHMLMGARRPGAGRGVRQRREPAPRARRRAPPRNRAAPRARRQPRRGIVRQLFAEARCWRATGAVLGMALAWWGRGAAARAAAVRQRRARARSAARRAGARRSPLPSPSTTALLFGLAPALRATRVDLTAQFQGGARTLGGGGRSRLSQALMVVQIALSLVLLVTHRAVRADARQSAGRSMPASTATASCSSRSTRCRQATHGRRVAGLSGAPPERRWRGARRPRRRLSRTSRCYRGSARTSAITVKGCTPPPGDPDHRQHERPGTELLQAMELPIVLGRGFTDGTTGADAKGRGRQPGVRAHLLRRAVADRPADDASVRCRPIGSRSSASPATRSTPSSAARRPRRSTSRRVSASTVRPNFALRVAGAGRYRRALSPSIRVGGAGDRSGATGAQPAHAGRADRSPQRPGAAVRAALGPVRPRWRWAWRRSGCMG